MKNLKTTILSAFIALCCLTNGNAQEAARGKNRGKVVTPGSQGSIVVFGGGTSMPSSDGKDKAFLSNSTAINADFFLPLIRKGWDGGGARDHVKGHKMDFGLNVGGTYNFGGSGGFGTTPNPFVVTGQTSSMVSDRGLDPRSPGFRMGAGPQANFYFGKFIVSPMVLGEYFSMTQKEMSIVQTTQFNGQSYDFNLATLPETKTSGFAVTPKLRLHYMFNDRFGLFADASYTMGPKIETTISKLIPNGNPSPQSGSYNIQQLQTGTMVKGETKSTAYSAMGFNFGVVIGLGGKEEPKSKEIIIEDRPVAVKKTYKNVATDEVISVSADDIKKGWNGLADATEELEPTTPSNARTINNCCNATVTGSILWDPTGTGTASSFVPATPSMSISTATVTAAGGVIFNSTINCLTYTGCTATVTYKVNGVTVTGSPAPCGVFNIPASYFPVAGGYTIKIIGNCAGVKCKAKRLQITIF
ncbi:hypothetical protein [Flavobacterium sp.]|jgi:hypothetical protein|uniref:hypothetical protein n=1 Tax=Flavobacterium sp. TaxID=239 RepID=UPI0037BF63A8